MKHFHMMGQVPNALGINPLELPIFLTQSYPDDIFFYVSTCYRAESFSCHVYHEAVRVLVSKMLK